MALVSANMLQMLQRGPDHGAPQAALWSRPVGTGPWVDWELVCEQVAALEASLPPGIALQAGQVLSIRALPLLGVVISCAPTTRAVLEAIERFSPLVCTESRFELGESGDRGWMCIELPPSPPAVHRLALELLLSFSTRMTRELCPPSSHGILGAELTHARPPHADLYDHYLGYPVRFGAAQNAYHFARRDLDLPLPGGDHALFGALCARAEDALLQQSESTTLRVKRALRELGPGSANPTQVCGRLRLGAATLQRRLGEEGTSWRQLVDEVRRELALEAMIQPEIHIKRLTETLGFSEPSAFYRAFRRWTGQRPRQFRIERGLRP